MQKMKIIEMKNLFIMVTGAKQMSGGEGGGMVATTLSLLVATWLGAAVATAAEGGSPTPPRVTASADASASVQALQAEFLKLKGGLFVHFGLATYTGVRASHGGYPDPSLFNPGVDTIDTDAWADAAKAAGLRYGVLTVKHATGFCLWDSQYTTYDVMNPKCPYKKDLVAQFVKSFTSRGLKVGLCYKWQYPGDIWCKMLPPECDPATHTQTQQKEFEKLQIAELLAKYPDVFYIWNDDLDKRIAPAAEMLTFMHGTRPDVLVSAKWRRWGFKGQPYGDVKVLEFGNFREDNKEPAETCFSLEQDWFWNASVQPRSAQEILGRWTATNRRNSNFLVVVAPDKQGRLSEASVRTLAELGRLRQPQAPGGKAAPTPPAVQTVPQPRAETSAAVKVMQEDFLKLKFGMFLHFNMPTYAGYEGYPDPALFNPGVETIDTDAWADAAKAVGMKYGVLTVKHVTGFCLWDSQYTTYGVMHPKCPYKKDLVAQFIKSFTSRGLKAGLYYCWQDPHEVHMKGLPPECDPATHTPAQQLDFQKAQIKELLTKYPEVFYIWNDGLDPEIADADEMMKFIHGIRPGVIASANWNDWSKKGQPYADIAVTELNQFPKGNKLPGETCGILEQSWFWRPGFHPNSAQNILAQLETANSRNANFLLNVAPDRQGRLGVESVKTLAEIGRLLKDAAAGSEK